MNRNTNTASRLAAALTAALMLASPVLAQSAGHDHAATTIEAKDFSFANPSVIPAGWTTLTLSNKGAAPHHVQIARLPAGTTAQAFLGKLRENEGAALASVAMVGGVGILMPGQSQTATLDLRVPGTYIELCFVPDDKGVPHLAQGMVSTFEVTKATTQSAAARPPKADAVAKLVDYGIDIPAVVKAGKQTWQVRNDGQEAHEMAMLKLAPGKTLDDVNAYMAKPEGAPPFAFAGGAQGVGKGLSSYVAFDLTPGDYVLVCFIPSPTHQGQPHAMLGMVRPFTVAAPSASR